MNREIRRWQQRARQIPDPRLRRFALSTQAGERGNPEGAAAFAVLAPRPHRAAVVGAAVAFQALYDYIDTLAEQPARDPVANGQTLHLALLAALDAERPHCDYYEHSDTAGDGGYVRAMIGRCREALAPLPSYGAVCGPALRAAHRMASYQSLNHGGAGQGHDGLARWAAGLTPAGSGLHWWETAAGAASSLGVFALIAGAARPGLGAIETEAVEDAYFPWIGALHVLLDSLVDHAADLRSGHHSLVDHYPCPEEAGRRLGAIAAQALQATGEITQGLHHALILAAMASFYLSRPDAHSPTAQPATERVLETMGSLAAPTMAVLRARRSAERLQARSSRRGIGPCGHSKEAAHPVT